MGLGCLSGAAAHTEVKPTSASAGSFLCLALYEL